MLKKMKILFGATLLCAATFINAAVIGQSETITLQNTNVNVMLEFDRFDDMGGTRTLNSVSFSINGFIIGSGSVENRSEQASTLVSTLSAQLSLEDEQQNILVLTLPTVSNAFEASGFDGDEDFGGTSGTTYDDLFAEALTQEVYTEADTLAFFSGGGVANFLFRASTMSMVTGSGNFISTFDTDAVGGIVEVSYDFTETQMQVSAPSHLALLGFGLLAFAGLRKVRK